MRLQFTTPIDLLQRIFRVLLLGWIVGGLGALAATLLVEAVLWLNSLWLPDNSPLNQILPAAYQPLAVMIILAIGGFITGLISLGIRGHRALGPPDLIQTVQTNLPQPQALKNALLSMTASIISLGSGASLGQYAPIVHIGGSIGQAINRWLRSDPSVSIACGVAAGIATVFHAPIAGIVFAHEVVLRHYSLRAFAPVTVAASTGSFLAKFVFDRPFLIDVVPSGNTLAAEALVFVAIGVLGALIAIAFMRLILTSQDIAQRLPLWHPLKPALAGVLLGIAAMPLPELLGIGMQTLNDAMTPTLFSPSELGILLVAKMLAAAMCFGLGMAGGVFSPALMIGLFAGGLIGHGIDFLFPDNHSGLAVFAVSGLAAVTSPVIGAPLATIMVIFELTHSYEIATAVMVSVVFSNVVAYRLFGRSLYDVQLQRQGLKLHLGRERLRLAQLPIDHLLSQQYTRLSPQQTLLEARERLVNNQHTQGYVCREDDSYIGMLSLSRIIALEASLDIRVEHTELHADAKSTRFSSEMTVWHAMQTMQDFIGESIPVVDPRTEQLRGVIYESSLINAYIDNLDRIREEEDAAA